MIKNFKEFSEQLQLSSEYRGNKQQLSKLEKWCKTNISSDLELEGKARDKYYFYYAMARDYFDIFISHLPPNPNTVIPEYNSMNPIQYAAFQGYNFFIDSLTTTNREAFDSATSAGMTPLHLAATFGHLATFKALLKHHPKPDLLNNNSQPPLFSALILPLSKTNTLMRKKETLFKTLKKLTPDMMEHQDKNGNSIFHLMAEQGFISLLNENLGSYSKLAFFKNNHCHYPVHTSILNNHLLTTKALLTLEGSDSLQDAQEQTPLHYAVRYGNAEMVEICCTLNNLNIEDTEGKTALSWAVQSDNLNGAQVLMQKGANPDKTD
jgi:ankyrin repeat protein